MSPLVRTQSLCAVAVAATIIGCGRSAAPLPAPLEAASLPEETPIRSAGPIKHVIVVLQENHSFDNIFHGYPGARWAKVGYGHDGRKIVPFPLPLVTEWDPAHQYEDWLVEYNGGAMNGFDLEKIDEGKNPPKDFAYGYARHKDVKPYWALANEGVLGDEMFDDHRSQTYASHLYAIAGAAGPIDSSHPDWYVANNPYGGTSCANQGYGEAIDIKTGETNVDYHTCFNFKTIGDLLTKRGVSWRYYVPDLDRESIFSGYASISHVFNGPQWLNVVSPETTIFNDIENGQLPAVSWVIPDFPRSDHPGQLVPSSSGPTWVGNVFNAIGSSRYWKDSAIILTFDDWGGWYDGVKPKTFDYYEAGFRLPLVIVSPYARRGYISHKVHYTGSILHFIEHTFGLGSLGKTDARSDRFEDCFDFAQRPLRYDPVDVPRSLYGLLETELPAFAQHPADPRLRD